MNCGSILSIGFEKAYLLQNDLNLQVSEIISTYVYKVGMINNDMSYSTAIGLFNTLINLVMIIICLLYTSIYPVCIQTVRLQHPAQFHRAEDGGKGSFL